MLFTFDQEEVLIRPRLLPQAELLWVTLGLLWVRDESGRRQLTFTPKRKRCHGAAAPVCAGEPGEHTGQQTHHNKGRFPPPGPTAGWDPDPCAAGRVGSVTWIFCGVFESALSLSNVCVHALRADW